MKTLHLKPASRQINNILSHDETLFDVIVPRISFRVRGLFYLEAQASITVTRPQILFLVMRFDDAIKLTPVCEVYLQRGGGVGRATLFANQRSLILTNYPPKANANIVGKRAGHISYLRVYGLVLHLLSLLLQWRSCRDRPDI